MNLGSAMCGGMRGVDCPMFGGLLSKFVGCAFQWGMLACINRSFRVRVGVGFWWWVNFSCIIVVGVMFWQMRDSLRAPEPLGGGRLK